MVADGPPREVLTEELLSRGLPHAVEVIAHPATGAPIILPRRGRGRLTVLAAHPTLAVRVRP